MGYTKPAHYTRQELVNFIIRDLVSDIRFSARKVTAGMNVDEEASYCGDLRQRLADIFHNRHTVRLDRYGWPILESFRQKGEKT